MICCLSCMDSCRLKLILTFICLLPMTGKSLLQCTAIVSHIYYVQLNYKRTLSALFIAG